MSKKEEIQCLTQLVLEHKEQGHFLPRSELEVLRHWAEHIRDFESAIFMIDGELKLFYEKASARGKDRKPSITHISKKILQMLKENQSIKSMC